MLSDDTLFNGVPDLKRCDGCGGMFAVAELKKCRNCGEYFCPECRKIHDCRTETGGRVSTDSVVLVAIEKELSNSGQLRNTVIANTTTVKEENHILCGGKQGHPGGNHGWLNELEPQLTVPDAEAVVENHNQSKKKCDGCGRLFDSAELKKCRNCGGYFCPECRKTHDCRTTSSVETYTRITQDERCHTKEVSDSDTKPNENPGVAIHSAPSANSANAIGLEPKTNEGARYSSEIRCDDCGKDYNITQMKRCIGCGALLCPTCRRTHTCRKKQELAKQASVQEVADLIPHQKQIRLPITKSEYNLPDEIGLSKSSVKIADKQSVPLEIPDVKTQLQEDFSLEAPDKLGYISPAIKDEKPAIPKSQHLAEDEMRCERCGKVFKKTDLRRCHKCGVVLCPACRKHHKCSDKWI